MNSLGGASVPSSSRRRTISSKNGASVAPIAWPTPDEGASGMIRCVQLQSAVLDRARDAAYPLHLPMPARAVIAFVNLHAIAPAVLRGVAGDVGRGQDRCGTGGFTHDAHDADARADRQTVSAP